MRPVLPLGHPQKIPYLSYEWFDRANVLLQAQDCPGDCVVIQHVVDVLAYEFVARDGRAGFEIIDAASARPAEQPRFSQSLDTAIAIASGQLDAHQAYLVGKISFDGNPKILIDQRPVFDWLAETLRPLIDDTDFTAPPPAFEAPSAG